MDDVGITLFEACELLNRSKKSISRYIKLGLLHPQKVKSKRGTLEYRFSKADIKAFKAQEVKKTGQTGQTRQDKRRQENEVLTLLRETTAFLKEQLVKKDEQIKDLGGKLDQLIERDRETNILIGQLQSKVLMLEKPKTDETRQDRQDRQDKKGFIKTVKDFLKIKIF